MDETIRLARPDDTEAMLAIYRPYVEQTAVTFEITTPTVDEFAQRIEHTLARFPWLALVRDGEVIGYAYADPVRSREAYAHSVEISIYLNDDAQGRGLGRRLYEELEAQLADAGIRNLYSCVTYSEDENDPYLSRRSVRFHEHMGFERVGIFHDCGLKFDRLYSVVWMEKLLGRRT